MLQVISKISLDTLSFFYCKKINEKGNKVKCYIPCTYTAATATMISLDCLFNALKRALIRCQSQSTAVVWFSVPFIVHVQNKVISIFSDYLLQQSGSRFLSL